MGPPVTDEERVGPPTTDQERVGAPDHWPGESWTPDHQPGDSGGPCPGCFFPGSPAHPPAPTRVSGASPIGLQVFQPGFQVVEQVDFLAALRAVNIQQFAVVCMPHLSRRLPRAGS